MKNAKELTKEMSEVFTLVKEGKISPAQCKEVTRVANWHLNNVKMELKAAEHRGDVVFPEFLKV